MNRLAAFGAAALAALTADDFYPERDSGIALARRPAD